MSLITYITRIHFADRVLEDALAEEMRRLRIRAPLLMIDGDAGAEARGRLADALPPGCAPAATLCAGDPDIDPGSGAGGDGVLGLGGRRALEAARRLREARGLPLIAAPTTLGAVGLGAGGLGGRGPCAARAPDAILCDPTLTLGASPARAAEAGMDALAHCVEAYLATAWNPPADGIALEGARRAARWLERAVAEPADLPARREVMAAALNAGLAAQKGLGGAEAAARALGAAPGLADRHGALHAALLPGFLAFNAPAVGDRAATLRAALGLAAGADLAAALAALAARLGLPARLGALGLDAAALRVAAETAAADPVGGANPRHATVADYDRLLHAAL